MSPHPSEKVSAPDHKVTTSFEGYKPSWVKVQLMIQRILNINGKLCTVLWDTGAQFSLIMHQYAREAGLKVVLHQFKSQVSGLEVRRDQKCNIGSCLIVASFGCWTCRPPLPKLDESHFLATSLLFLMAAAQRIWINNRSPRSTFCRWKLLQILSPCVLSALPPPPPPPATADHPPPASCLPSPRHTRREDLEQFRTTESF